jgi:LemA protein
MSTLFTAVVVIIALLAVWLIGVYNNLVRLRNQVKNGWSQIDVQLQRRYDLIPNLIEAVKGYMNYEKQTLTDVITARNQASHALDAAAKQGLTQELMQQLMSAEATLNKTLPQIFALAESYPDLKASQNMQQLQEELASTENKVAFSRQAYNDLVLNYNNAQEVIPANLIAKIFGHTPSSLFEVEKEEVKKAPQVRF